MGQLQIDSFYASQTAGSPFYKNSLLEARFKGKGNVY
jgi:hypothetical protein